MFKIHMAKAPNAGTQAAFSLIQGSYPSGSQNAAPRLAAAVITWELLRKSTSQVPSQTYWIRNLGYLRLPWIRNLAIYVSTSPAGDSPKSKVLGPLLTIILLGDNEHLIATAALH